MKPLIIANWKSNPDSLSKALNLARYIEASARKFKNTEVVVSPPFLYLSGLAGVLRKAELGAQNAFWTGGPYTGEVSPVELRSAGVRYVIVGHSERRINLGETDVMINKKIRSILEEKMIPVVCIEKIPELRRALKGVSGAVVDRVVIAYEPRWAISTMPGARPDTPEHAGRAIADLRKTAVKLYGKKITARVRFIYGGSVNSGNIKGFLAGARAVGALVGGVSLRPKEFDSLLRQAS